MRRSWVCGPGWGSTEEEMARVNADFDTHGVIRNQQNMQLTYLATGKECEER